MQFKIVRKSGEGTLSVWREMDGTIFIRESLDRGRDVHTVSLTEKELSQIVKKLEITKST